MIDTIVRVAENTVDEVTNAEGREVRLEEDFVLQVSLFCISTSSDNFSAR
jgi:hypothetical protein